MADVASDMALPLGVVRVLLADLILQGRMTVHAPAAAGEQPSTDLLKEVCMDSAPSDRTAPAAPLAAFKILVAGGFGAGKTTLVGAVSEVRPLCTEELLTGASRRRRPRRRGGQDHHDRGDGLRPDHHRRATCCCTCSARPGQDRFWFMWDELS